MELNKKKVLILHPFLRFSGGAEYMLSVLANEIFPESDIFVFSYDKNVLHSLGIDESRIISPFKDSFLGGFYKYLSFLYPSLIESYNFTKYDIIISNTYAYVHGLITVPEQLHVSFVLTPMRALWIDYEYYLSSVPLVGQFMKSTLSWHRIWDKVAANRPDYMVAISEEVKARIKSFWNRESEVIYPPVPTVKYSAENTKKNYYVTVSRLVKHKRIDIIIEAFKKLGEELIIIGDGPYKATLMNLANGAENIKFLGHISETEKITVISEAQGFIFAGYEDFGISLVESMAAGTPVLAYKKGGALETVIPGVTGEFYSEQTAESLLESFGSFKKNISDGIYSAAKMKESAEKFSTEVFIKNVKLYISTKLEESEKSGPPVNE